MFGGSGRRGSNPRPSAWEAKGFPLSRAVLTACALVGALVSLVFRRLLDRGAQLRAVVAVLDQVFLDVPVAVLFGGHRFGFDLATDQAAVIGDLVVATKDVIGTVDGRPATIVRGSVLSQNDGNVFANPDAFRPA